MASNSGWDKAVPSGSSSIAKGDDDIRSFKSFMEAWWEQEHYATSGSASSAGVAKRGAGRAFVGTTSQLSNPTADNDGRFLWTTDTETLYVAQASSSSWSAVADAIQLGSEQTWTATQEFSDVVVTGAISGLTSEHTVLASAVGAAAGASSTGILFTNLGNRFSRGDFLVASCTSQQGAEPYFFSPVFNISNDSLFVRFYSRDGGSRTTIPSGTTVSIMGFGSDV